VSGPLLLGVDIGTQSVKAGLFRLDGARIAQASAPLPLFRRAGDEVYQEPEDFCRLVTSVIGSCMAKSSRPGDVAAIGIAGQMAGILGIGPRGEAVTPYDSWLDSRCHAEVAEIDDRLGDRLVKLTGCPPMVAHAPKILWWRRNHPAAYASVAKFVVPSAFVSGWLCGLSAADAYVDSTHLHFSGLADTAQKVWSAELADEIGVDMKILPRITSPTRQIGSLTADAAAKCGLRAGTPVAAGLGDTAAGALGAGVVEEGQLLDTAGTASVLGVSVTQFRTDASRALVLMSGAVPGQWISLAYLAGGDLLGWLPGVLGGGSLDVLVQEAASATGGGPLFVPHLAGRILPAAPHARGGWIGLQVSHTRGDLTRAVLESVAFEYAGFLERALHLFPGLVPREIRVIGGGSGNMLWNLIKASALGVAYVRPRRQDFTCWGAALVAAAAVGAVDDLAATALHTAGQADRVEPDRSLQSIYAERLRDYREAVGMLVSPVRRSHCE